MNLFYSSIKTITYEFQEDLKLYSQNNLSRNSIIKKYGHLRPGTYDILQKAYWEDSDLFLNKNYQNLKNNIKKFKFSKNKLNKINNILRINKISINAHHLINYFINSVEMREKVKFHFTKFLSKSFDLILVIFQNQITRKDLNYLTLEDIFKFSKKTITLDKLKKVIEFRKAQEKKYSSIKLPSFISHENSFYFFNSFTEPSFISNIQITANPFKFNNEKDINLLKNKIIFIKNADPGYDWLLGCKIKGLVTMYGGPNSHMAIRCSELGLPAVLGVGEGLFNKLINYRFVHINPDKKIIEGIF